VAASDHKLVHHLLHKLQTPLRPALGLAAAIALIRAIVVKRIVQRLEQLQRLLHYHEPGYLDHGRQYRRVLLEALLSILFNAQHRQCTHQRVIVLLAGDGLVQQCNAKRQTCFLDL
jgi:hypothetical protein